MMQYELQGINLSLFVCWGTPNYGRHSNIQWGIYSIKKRYGNCCQMTEKWDFFEVKKLFFLFVRDRNYSDFFSEYFFSRWMAGETFFYIKREGREKGGQGILTKGSKADGRFFSTLFFFTTRYENIVKPIKELNQNISGHSTAESPPPLSSI